MCHQVLNWVQMAEAWVDITEDVKLLLLLFLTHVIHYQMLFLNLPFILTTPLAPVGEKKEKRRLTLPYLTVGLVYMRVTIVFSASMILKRHHKIEIDEVVKKKKNSRFGT